ncbi:MAG: 50S ribosomal protein L14e [Candidatus Aenigmatarchaeota archaeon]
MEIGRVCVKLVGKEKGKYCVVVKNVDKNFVIVSGPKILTGVKRRRVNIIHLQPTQYKLEIEEDVSDEKLLEAWEKSGLIDKLGFKRPSAHLLKKKEEGKEEKIEEKVEEGKKVKSKKS